MVELPKEQMEKSGMNYIMTVLTIIAVLGAMYAAGLYVAGKMDEKRKNEKKADDDANH